MSHAKTACRLSVISLLALFALVVAHCPLNLCNAAEPAGGKLVPLKPELPKPLFVGTPKNIPASPNLEKYSEKAPAPLMIPEGSTNLALKAKVTSSDPSPIIGELSLATDGDKDGGDGSFVELAPGKQWLQVDLGKSADLSAAVIWHYHGEGRVYHSVVIQVSDDPDFAQGVKTVFNADYANALGLGAGKNLEYIDDYRGKAIDIRVNGQPVRGRYVRFWSNGNTSNDQNHYIEVEVYGKPAA
jgi:hypothetical protein